MNQCVRGSHIFFQREFVWKKKVLCLKNYQIGFELIFLSDLNIILKLHIKPIIRFEACNVFNYAY